MGICNIFGKIMLSLVIQTFLGFDFFLTSYIKPSKCSNDRGVPLKMGTTTQ